MIRIITDLADKNLLGKCMPWQLIQDERTTYQALWGKIWQCSIAMELSPNLQTNFLVSVSDLIARTDKIISTRPCRMILRNEKPMLVPASKKQDENFLFLTVSCNQQLRDDDVVTEKAEVILFHTAEVDDAWIVQVAVKIGKQGYIELPEIQRKGISAKLRYKRYSFASGNEQSPVDDTRSLEMLIKHHNSEFKAEKNSATARPELLPRLELLNHILEYSTYHYPAFELRVADILINDTVVEKPSFRIVKLPGNKIRYSSKNVLRLEQLTLVLVAGIEPLTVVTDVELLVRVLHADPIGNVHLCQTIAYALTWYHPLRGGTETFALNCRFTHAELITAQHTIIKWEFQRLLRQHQFGVDQDVARFNQEGVQISLAGKTDFYDYTKEDYCRLQSDINHFEHIYHEMVL